MAELIVRQRRSLFDLLFRNSLISPLTTPPPPPPSQSPSSPQTTWPYGRVVLTPAAGPAATQREIVVRRCFCFRSRKPLINFSSGKTEKGGLGRRGRRGGWRDGRERESLLRVSVISPFGGNGNFGTPVGHAQAPDTSHLIGSTRPTTTTPEKMKRRRAHWR